MNQIAIQQNAFSAREEMRSSVVVSVTDRRDMMVCPKPRRLGVVNAAVNDHPIRPLKWHHCHPLELCDSRAGNDVLDLLFFKGGCGLEPYHTNTTQLASPPPFLCGSPPSRVANPLIQDARFRDEKLSPFSAVVAQFPSSPPPSSSGRKGGCVRANFANNPMVRVEGFDCLDRDRRNRSIPALA